MVHVQQNEETKKVFNKDVKTEEDYKEYELLKESLAKEKVDALLRKGYNYGVSEYAKESYKKYVYTEVMAEMYAYVSLERIKS